MKDNTVINLIFIHGFAMKSDIWDGFYDGSDNVNVHCPDLYDYLENDLSVEPSLSFWSGLLFDYISQNNLTNVVLVGHSMGGYIGLDMLKKDNANIKGLVLFHSHSLEDDNAKKNERDKTIKFINKHGKNVFYDKFFPPLFYKKNHLKKVIHKVIHNSDRISTEAIIWSIEAMKNRLECLCLLRSTNIPICCIIGEKDSLISEKNSLLTALSTNIGVIHILEDIGHMGMLEDKEKCNNIVKNFLDLLTL